MGADVPYTPIPAYIDQMRAYIRIGELLGVPAPVVPELPPEWIDIAVIELAVRNHR